MDGHHRSIVWSIVFRLGWRFSIKRSIGVDSGHYWKKAVNSKLMMREEVKCCLRRRISWSCKRLGLPFSASSVHSSSSTYFGLQRESSQRSFGIIVVPPHTRHANFLHNNGSYFLRLLLRAVLMLTFIPRWFSDFLAQFSHPIFIFISFAFFSVSRYHSELFSSLVAEFWRRWTHWLDLS